MKTDSNLLVVAYHLARLHARPPIVPGEHCLDREAFAHFCELLEQPGLDYLEYGSGGCTLYASPRVRTLVSVDSDARYLAAVGEQLDRGDAQLIHVDIGLTYKWGRPVVVDLVPERRARWRLYAAAPWPWLHTHGIQPDVVLIDGRFRVACALTALLHIHRDFRMLIDDYRARPWYSGFEQFAELAGMHGRMAEFRPRPGLDREACSDALLRYESDYR